MLSVNALTRLLKANATTSPTATTTTSPRIRKFLNPLNISIPPDPEYTILGGFLLHWEILNTPEGVQEWGEVRFLLVGEAYRKPFALEIPASTSVGTDAARTAARKVVDGWAARRR